LISTARQGSAQTTSRRVKAMVRRDKYCMTHLLASMIPNVMAMMLRKRQCLFAALRRRIRPEDRVIAAEHDRDHPRLNTLTYERADRLHRRLNAERVDRIGDGRCARHRGRLAAAKRRLLRTIEQHGLDLWDLGEGQDRISAPVKAGYT